MDCARDKMLMLCHFFTSALCLAWATEEYLSDCILASLYEQIILCERIRSHDLRDHAPEKACCRMKPEARCVTRHVRCHEPVINGLLPSSKLVFGWTAEQSYKGLSRCLFNEKCDLMVSLFVCLVHLERCLAHRADVDLGLITSF